MDLVPRPQPTREPPEVPLRRMRFRRAGRLAGAVAAAMLAGLLAVGTAAAGGGGSISGTLYVSTSGSDSSHCTWSHPCRTIGHAVWAAAPGSRIRVDEGTYHEQVFITKRLTLVSDGATIDAHGLLGTLEPLKGFGVIGMAVLVFGHGADGTVIRNFRIQNAPAEGILTVMTSGVSIFHNEVVHNDRGATTAFNPAPAECAQQGNVPGDCGEGIHLIATSWSTAEGNNVHDNVGGFLLTDEIGPTHHNVIADNISRNNKLDCGITLPSHNGQAVASPSKGGVYDNLIIHNVSEGNGGAGVGMFAPFPGTASYDNTIVGNVLRNNGEAGIAIHAHDVNQNVSGNVMVGNYVSGNGVDPDFVNPTTHIGILIGSAKTSKVNVVVAANRIAHEDVGIYRVGPVVVRGLHSNKFASSVAVRIH